MSSRIGASATLGPLGLQGEGNWMLGGRGALRASAINLNSGPWWDHEPCPAVVDGDVRTSGLELLELVESTPVRRCRCSNWRLVASARPPRVTGRSSPATSCLTKAMRSALSTTLWPLSLNVGAGQYVEIGCTHHEVAVDCRIGQGGEVRKISSEAGGSRASNC